MIVTIINVNQGLNWRVEQVNHGHLPLQNEKVADFNGKADIALIIIIRILMFDCENSLFSVTLVGKPIFLILSL